MTVFLEENTKINLSALRTEETCWIGNILDSLSFLKVTAGMNLPDTYTVMDVGTGGGFPLLPLAIVLPQAQHTGLDAVGKKINAIGHIVKTLGLTNVHLYKERSEVAGRDPRHRDHYNIVTSRAVAPLNILLEFTAPFAKTGGHVVLWKSLHIDEELKASEGAQRKLQCPLVTQYEYDLGGDWGKRQLLVFKKEASTPKEYPRGVGEPKKEPL